MKNCKNVACREALFIKASPFTMCYNIIKEGGFIMFKAKTCIAFLCILVYGVLVGCSHNNSSDGYYSAAKQFNKVYFGLVKNIDTTNAMKTMEELQTESSKRCIDELEKLLEQIKKHIPKEKEKLYDNFKGRYEDLVFLVNCYSEYNQLDRDQKRKIDIVLINIGMMKDNWNDKGSTILWQ